jgi:hypothetical protein
MPLNNGRPVITGVVRFAHGNAVAAEPARRYRAALRCQLAAHRAGLSNRQTVRLRA